MAARAATNGRWKRDQALRIATMMGYSDDCLRLAFVRGFRRVHQDVDIDKR